METIAIARKWISNNNKKKINCNQLLSLCVVDFERIIRFFYVQLHIVNEVPLKKIEASDK